MLDRSFFICVCPIHFPFSRRSAGRALF
jgi:hypothetical protein